MNKRLVLISLLLITGFGLQAAQLRHNGGAMFHIPGTPPRRNEICNRKPKNKQAGKSQRPQKFHFFQSGVGLKSRKRVGKLQFRHQPDSIGSGSWQCDIIDRLQCLVQQLPPESPQHAASLKERYDNYFGVVQKDSELIQDFLRKNKYAQELITKEVETAKSYLKAITTHYNELSELDFNGHPAVGAIQDLVFEEGVVGELTLRTLNVKNDLENLMREFDLLPDDYDDGLT